MFKFLLILDKFKYLFLNTIKKIGILKKKIVFRLVIIGLIFISTSVFMLSCGKKEVNTFSGKVLNMSSGESVEGIKVYLDAAKILSGSINSAFSQIAETTTAVDGSYYLECEPAAYLRFRIRLEKKGYHKTVQEFDPLDQRYDYSKDYTVAIQSYLNIKVLNIQPMSDNDEFKIRIEKVDENCIECCNGEFRYFQGAYVDSEFSCKTVGGDTIVIYSVSIHNGQSTIKSNSVYCIPGDTVFYNAYY